MKTPRVASPPQVPADKASRLVQRPVSDETCCLYRCLIHVAWYRDNSDESSNVLTCSRLTLSPQDFFEDPDKMCAQRLIFCLHTHAILMCLHIISDTRRVTMTCFLTQQVEKSQLPGNLSQQAECNQQKRRIGPSHHYIVYQSLVLLQQSVIRNATKHFL